MRGLLLGIVVLLSSCGKPSFVVNDPDGGKASGTLLLDGKPFEARACGTGEMWGFRGVVFEAKGGGRQVWVAWQLGGKAKVTIQDGPRDYEVMKDCGTIDVKGTPQKDGPDKMSGRFEVDCSQDGHSVKGKVTFENCV